MTKIAICDDHKIVREGLKQIINGFNDFEVILDVESGEALIKELRNSEVEIVVLDVSLPGRNGLEVLKQIRSMYEHLKVLMLSMYPEDQFAIRALKAGASGYLHKDSQPDILVEALRTIAKGGEYLSPAITSLLFKEVNSDGNGLPHKILSDREYEVLLYIGEGKSISEIANQLSLSVKTISTYRSRILEKMSLDNNSDLVKYILMHDLAPSV
ncbi:MAG: response regulator transcription factor [Flavobacteriales bacterium]|nr:response regulator transcription factor [Flavobacteriales bacterium]MDG1765813.1 response regulator transcription factor [Flavobacteriales bacterium]